MKNPETACLLSTFYSNHQSVNIEGVETLYYDSISQHGHHPKDQAIVVAIHGGLTSGYLFRQLIPDLADHCRLIIPDLPGFGRSQKRLTWPAKPKRYLSWLNSFLEEILPPKKQVFFVGHDFGAVLALAWAQKKPDITGGLLITNNYIAAEYLYPQFLPIAGALSFVGSSIAEYIATKSLISKVLKRSFFKSPDPTLIDCYASVYQQKDARRILANFLWHTNKIPSLLWQLRRNASELKCPIIFLFGEKDRYFRQDTCEKLASFFKKSSYRLLPDVGYQVPDEAPDTVSAELKALIIGHAPS